MRRTLATTAAALAMTAAAATPALAVPAYPPTTPPQVQESVVPSSQAGPSGSTVQGRVDSVSAAPSALAFTGTDTAVLVGGAALLVAGGAVLVRSARRRGTHSV